LKATGKELKHQKIYLYKAKVIIEKISKLGEGKISATQKEALTAIRKWANTKKTPMPKKELFKALVLADMSESTARKAIEALVKNGYIRRAVAVSNQTFYVLLKWV